MDLPELEEIKRYSYEMGAIRPPSEGGSRSLLIRATRNCPWNRCSFCYGSPYKRAKFELRSVEEIKGDIQAAKSIMDLIETIERKLGGIEWAMTALDSYSLYEREPPYLDDEELKNLQCIVNVFNWLCSGGKTVFLQDANSLIMRTPQLVEVVQYLKETFHSIQRITTYARSKTLAQKSLEELKELKETGLTRLHVGLETGDDELLEYIHKGVTSEEQILGGRKAKEAGLELSEYVMPGLGGKAMSDQHARNTARVLNETDPDFIRMRTYFPNPLTPLFGKFTKGDFKLLSPHECLMEIRTLVENLEVTSQMTFDHVMNFWCNRYGEPLFTKDYVGYKFPEEKTLVLELIEEGLEVDESMHSNIRMQIRSL
ncbi:MAG: radical SAM protein [Halobacteriota archaeon]|nr:radical SAM protein [Halobacteriota archaeon]